MQDRHGDERTLTLKNFEFQARPGNVITTLYGLRNEAPVLIGLKNHDTHVAVMTPKGIDPWFRGQTFGVPFGAVGLVICLVAISVRYNMATWAYFSLSVLAVLAVIVPLQRYFEPYRRESDRIRSYLEAMPYPQELRMSGSDRQNITQQNNFYAPNHGTIAHNYYVSARLTFPGEKLRSLIKGDQELEALGILESEINSPTPSKSRVSTSVEVLKNVSGVASIVNSWVIQPDVQHWIASLLP